MSGRADDARQRDERFVRGAVDGARDRWAQDPAWQTESAGPPWSGRIEGREAARGVLAQIDPPRDMSALVRQEYLGDGDTVAGLGPMDATGPDRTGC